MFSETVIYVLYPVDTFYFSSHEDKFYAVKTCFEDGCSLLVIEH